MHEGDGLSAKTLGKSLFHFQTDWQSNGPADQFCQMESALNFRNISAYEFGEPAILASKRAVNSVKMGRLQEQY